MNKKLLLLIGLVLVGWLTATAQKSTITGKVTAADDGSAIPGAYVVEKGTTNGTTTDGSGNFTITVSNTSSTVQFSFLGYITQEVLVANQSVLNVSLQTDILTLSEVVVVGYGQQDKKDVTGSVAAITSKDFNKGIISSPQDMLIGKVAGVQISTNDGSPGSNATIRIRGTGSIGASQDPLIVIDGFPVDNGNSGPNGATTNTAGVSNPLATINPNDIESYTVLKDASATAIYGVRASNGVIIITTKKGKQGKPQISYNGNFSVSTPMKYYKVLTGDEMRATAKTLLDEGSIGLTADNYARLGKVNTDWQKEIYRNAISHDHNINVSGTYKDLPYRVSYGYTDQEGILKTTNFVRNSLNINLTPTFFDGDLKVTASMKGSYTQQNFGNGSAQSAAVLFDPTQPVYNGSTRWGGYFAWVGPASATTLDPNGDPLALAAGNPVSLLMQNNNHSNAYRGLGNVQLDYRLRFLPELKLTVNAGIDYTTSKGNDNAPLTAAWTHVNGDGQKKIYTAENKSQLLDLYANYLRTIGRSKVDVTAGYSYQSFTRDGSSYSANGQDSTSVLYVPLYYQTAADGHNIARQNIPNPNTLLSFFGRLNYSFDNRYLLTVSFRDDASSRFAPQNRWKIFPSAAVGWNISKEAFMSNSSVVSDLKLRASYGLTGQQDISGSNPYPYLSVYQQSAGTNYYQFGVNDAGKNNYIPTLRPQPYDANIRWETTVQADIGLDFGLLDNRISGSVDVFQKNTNDLINAIPVAGGTNLSNFITTNVGNLVNKGIEVTVRTIPVKTDNFEWNLGFNFTSIRNEVTKLLKRDDPNYTGVATGGIGLGKYIQNIQVGHAINSFLVYQQVYDQQGKPIEGLYVDRTGKGGDITGNENNKYYDHKPNPDFLVGINSRLNYKKWDLYFSGRLSIGNYVYNNVYAGANYSNLYNPSGFFNNLPAVVNDTKFVTAQVFSDYYVQNASFFKMDNVNLGYNLSDKKLKARISLTVQNAFFVTKYKGIDPEVISGLDNNQYPRPRTFMLGLSITY